MAKRPREDSREEVVDIDRPAKRLRCSKTDRLSSLSDELLVRTLSYLPISDLVCCQRLSRRLKSLAGDSQLWKALYFDRFVRPRASRIPGVRDKECSARSLYYSSKLSKWLDDDHLVKAGRATNWKRQYKLRHNWSRGSANVGETQIAERSSTPPLLVGLHDGIVITADLATGLKAWLLTGEMTDRVIAGTRLCLCKDPGETSAAPTSLAIDSTESLSDRVNVSLGFEDGSFAIFTLRRNERSFIRQYTHAPSRNSIILAIAYASPYLLTMTGAQLLSLYHFSDDPNEKLDNHGVPLPTLLSSLRSHTAYPPISLAIRTSSISVIASIAYAIPTLARGWSVGLQELRLSREGIILDSRMASASSSPLTPPLSSFYQPSISPILKMKASLVPNNNISRIPTSTKPTSMSYNHPYLLSAHADNTLTLYMVTSNTEELTVGAGNRLWGHTSSVSGAHVGDRGKAVSVSAVGNELRVWELEGGIASAGSRKRAAAGEASIQVRPERKDIGKPTKNDVRETSDSVNALRSELGSLQSNDESAITKGWVAFDEEKVVLLREKTAGAQALVVYDFS